MAVMVTGGAGYIGSVAVEKLLESGEKVIVLDNLSRGHREAIENDAIFVEGDTRDRELLRSTFEKYDIETVMHFAAFALVGESVSNPAIYFENNVNGAHVLLNTMVDCGIKQFIFSSTCATYGFPDKVPLTEDLPTNPINPYGLSKLMIEQILQWYTQAYDFRYVALRYFNACGATEKHGEEHEPETHLIPNIFKALDGDAPSLKIFGDDYDTPDGTCVRDYIHITDLVDAHKKAMAYLRNGGTSDFFNLGTESGNSVFEVLNAVEEVTGKKVPYEMDARRPGDADKLIACSTKAHQTLGWKPEQCDVRTTVEDAWRWYQGHPNGYGSA